LVKRLDADHETADLRAGLIAATVANYSRVRDPKDPPVTPSDFFGGSKSAPSRDAKELISSFKERFKKG
jgi:hypothetical protein